MKAQLLKQPPISGTFPERWYEAVGDCTWVLFEDKDYQDWVGVFGQGRMTRFSTALLFNTTPAALVISHGRGYVVNVNSGELVYRIQGDDLVDAIAIPDRDLITTTDAFVRLRALTSTRQAWRSEDVALDGIRYEQATPHCLTGQVWQYDGWHTFSLHFDVGLSLRSDAW